MQPPTVYEYAAPWPCKYGFEQNIFFAVCLQVGKVTSWTGPGSGGFIPPDHKNPPKWAPKCFGGVYQILLVMQSIYSAKAFKVAFFCPCQSCKPDSNRLLYTFWGEITSNISGGKPTWIGHWLQSHLYPGGHQRHQGGTIMAWLGLLLGWLGSSLR